MDCKYDAASGLYRYEALGVSKLLTQELLATSYLRMKGDQIIDTVYYERVPTLMEYMARCLKPESICLGAFRNVSSKNAEFAGVSWIFDREEMGDHRVKGEVGFCFFRKCASPDEKVLLGRMMAQILFEIYNCDLLIGTTPVDNKLALSYSKQLGFTQHGPIPGYLSWEGGASDAVVSVLAKQDWRERWRDEQFLGEREVA